ncbi:hypothetical protein [Armatimonas rosea]|uniref:Uncharacterized protein n=1 Tax=Armatimonas rosea TaxID=685828 RepID=A0A7W9STJ6_ARMRO|nr:hypothetical protein [Armatimonas rosea]MBB6052135.1 hypothetical protein [Armatimonas rosea]
MLRAVGGSFLATLIGWSVGAACWLVWAPIAFFYMGFVILPLWLLVLLPLYLFLPRESFLWQARFALPLGAAAGGLLVAALLAVTGAWKEVNLFFLLDALTGAITGGTACYAATKNVSRYR